MPDWQVRDAADVSFLLPRYFEFRERLWTPDRQTGYWNNPCSDTLAISGDLPRRILPSILVQLSEMQLLDISIIINSAETLLPGSLFVGFIQIFARVIKFTKK